MIRAFTFICLIFFCTETFASDIDLTARTLFSQFVDRPFSLELDESNERFAQLIVKIDGTDKEKLLTRGGVRLRLIREILNECYQKNFLLRQKENFLEGLHRRPLKVIVVAK